MPDNFCPSCGAPARPGARFCPSCGQAVESGARPAPMPMPAPPPPSGGAMPFTAARPAPAPRPKANALIIVQGAVLTLFTIVVGAVGIYSVQRMGDAGGILYAEAVEGLGRAATMGEGFATLRSVLRDLCIDTDQAANRAQKEMIDTGRVILRENMRHLQDSAKNNPDKRAMVEEVARAMEAYFRASDEVMDLAMANRSAEAVRWLRTGAVPASYTFRDDLARLNEFMYDIAEARMEKNEAASRTFKLTLAVCLAAAVALGLATTALLAAAKR